MEKDLRRGHGCELVRLSLIATLARQTRKHFTFGTHRVLCPEELVERVRPFLRVAGVTRLANITGLDRIGIPSASAIRPAGRTLSAAAGKGLTLEAAMASAAMEAIELFAAENADLPCVASTLAALSDAHAVVALEALPMRRHAIVAPHLPIRWTYGVDLLNAQCLAVPLDIVTLDDDLTSTTPFYRTSSGLASGAVLAEALLAALLEVIERDAVACQRAAARAASRGLPRVRLESLSQMPIVQDLLRRFEEAEVETALYDCTVDTAIPVYLARVWDRDTRHVGVCYGSGAHLDPEIAIVRALTEAAQSRAVYIAGSRDDLFARGFAQFKAQDSASVIASLAREPATVDASAAHSMASSTFEEDVECILQRLRSVGVTSVVMVDLTPAVFEDRVSVVRVIAPGLAGAWVEHGGRSARAETFAQRAAA